MKKRIAFISDHASPLSILGGADIGGHIYIVELAKHLAELGYEIDIFTRKDAEDLPDVVDWQKGIRIVHTVAGPARYIPKEDLLQYIPDFTKNMLAFIRKEKIRYALVHAHFWMSGLVACQLKTIMNLPFVITFHALGYMQRLFQKEANKFSPCRIEAEKFIIKQAAGIIAECPQDKNDLINYYQAKENKIHIIPCGFSKHEFQPIEQSEARKMLGLNDNERILLQLGRIAPCKGIDNVILAMARLKKYSNIRLLIVGGDSSPASPSSAEMLRLKGIAINENVSEIVNFTGHKNREMLKYYYSAADIFITTPWYEPFGITPLEAMACGTPVIGADVGGIKYSVVNGYTGFLVPPDQPEALAQKIEILLDNQQLLLSMGVHAIEHVNSEFTWSHVSNLVDSLYSYIQRIPQGMRVSHQTKAA